MRSTLRTAARFGASRRTLRCAPPLYSISTRTAGPNRFCSATSAPTPMRWMRRPASCAGRRGCTNTASQPSRALPRCTTASWSCRSRHSKSSPPRARNIPAAASAAPSLDSMSPRGRYFGPTSLPRRRAPLSRTPRARRCRGPRERRCGPASPSTPSAASSTRRPERTIPPPPRTPATPCSRSTSLAAYANGSRKLRLTMPGTALVRAAHRTAQKRTVPTTT